MCHRPFRKRNFPNGRRCLGPHNPLLPTAKHASHHPVDHPALAGRGRLDVHTPLARRWSGAPLRRDAIGRSDLVRRCVGLANHRDPVTTFHRPHATRWWRLRRTCPGLRSPPNYRCRRTRSARTSAASTPSSVPTTAPRRSDVPANCGCSQLSAASTTSGQVEGDLDRIARHAVPPADHTRDHFHRRYSPSAVRLSWAEARSGCTAWAAPTPRRAPWPGRWRPSRR